MPSTPDLDISAGYAAGAPAAQDRVAAAQVDSDHRAIISWANNNLLPSLARVIRDDDTLEDQIVRLRNLHPEVVSALEGLTVLEGADVAALANVALTGLQTIDGYLTIAGDRVLCVGQTNPLQNGLWVAAAGAWTRPSDFANGSTQVVNTVLDVFNGNTQTGSTWRLAVAAVVDSTSETWAQLSGLGSLVAVSRGGTGAGTALGARQNLGFTTAMEPLHTAASVGAARTALGNVAATVDSIADLKALATTDLVGTVLVRGYYAANDGGGSHFRYNAGSVVADDAATVIAPNAGAGRWERLIIDGIYNVKFFGAKGDGLTDDTAAIQKALTSGALEVYIPLATYRIDGTLVVPDSVKVRCLGTLKRFSGFSASSAAILNLRGSYASWDGGVLETQNNHPLGIAVLGHENNTTASYNSLFWRFSNVRILGVQFAGNIGILVTSAQFTIGASAANYFGYVSNVVVDRTDVGCQIEEIANSHEFYGVRFWRCITAGFRLYGAYNNRIYGGFLHTSTNGVIGLALMNQRIAGPHDTFSTYIYGFSVEPGGAASQGVYIDTLCARNYIDILDNVSGGNTINNTQNKIFAAFQTHQMPTNRTLATGAITAAGIITEGTAGMASARHVEINNFASLGENITQTIASITIGTRQNYLVTVDLVIRNAGLDKESVFHVVYALKRISAGTITATALHTLSDGTGLTISWDVSASPALLKITTFNNGTSTTYNVSWRVTVQAAGAAPVVA